MSDQEPKEERTIKVDKTLFRLLDILAQLGEVIQEELKQQVKENENEEQKDN